MKKILFLSFLLAVGGTTQAQTKTWIDQPYIEVTGKSEMEVTPDEIYVNINISENDNKAKKSVEQLEKEMKEALQKVGIDVEKQLRVKGMDSNFEKYWYQRSSQIHTSKFYQLLVHNATELGKAGQAIEGVGISNIHIERVAHSKIEQLRREVKINAAKNAKQKAEDLVQAVGQSLGNALHLQEVDYAPYRPMRAPVARTKALSVSMEAAEPEPELEFEKIKIEYSVVAKFAIK